MGHNKFLTPPRAVYAFKVSIGRLVPFKILYQCPHQQSFKSKVVDSTKAVPNQFKTFYVKRFYITRRCIKCIVKKVLGSTTIEFSNRRNYKKESVHISSDTRRHA